MSEFGFYFDNEGDTSHSFIIDSNPDQINPYTQQEEEKKKQSANQDQEVINDDPQSASGQLLLPEHVRIAQDKKRKQTEAEERDGSEDGDHQEKENLDGEQDGASQDGKQSEIKDGTGDYLQLDVRSRGVSLTSIIGLSHGKRIKEGNIRAALIQTLSFASNNLHLCPPGSFKILSSR